MLPLSRVDGPDSPSVCGLPFGLDVAISPGVLSLLVYGSINLWGQQAGARETQVLLMNPETIYAFPGYGARREPDPRLPVRMSTADQPRPFG